MVVTFVRLKKKSSLANSENLADPTKQVLAKQLYFSFDLLLKMYMIFTAPPQGPGKREGDMSATFNT